MHRFVNLNKHIFIIKHFFPYFVAFKLLSVTSQQEVQIKYENLNNNLLDKYFSPEYI